MKKTSAQLNREINDALAGGPSNTALQISDRRIAALIANGEDVRNTPAWRDAMHERRAIDARARLASPGAAKSKRGIRSEHERVMITWYVIPNENKARGGFMPVYEHGGKVRGDTYGRGYDKAEAEKRAEAMAREEAARYIGDWDVTVKKGRAKK